MKFLIIQFSPDSSYFRCLLCYYSPQHPDVSPKPRCTLYYSLPNQLHAAVLHNALQFPPPVTTLPTFYGTCRFTILFTTVRQLSQSSARRILSTFSNPTSLRSSLIITLSIMPRYWNFRNRFFANPLANVFSDSDL